METIGEVDVRSPNEGAAIDEDDTAIGSRSDWQKVGEVDTAFTNKGVAVDSRRDGEAVDRPSGSPNKRVAVDFDITIGSRSELTAVDEADDVDAVVCCRYPVSLRSASCLRRSTEASALSVGLKGIGKQ